MVLWCRDTNSAWEKDTCFSLQAVCFTSGWRLHPSFKPGWSWRWCNLQTEWVNSRPRPSTSAHSSSKLRHCVDFLPPPPVYIESSGARCAVAPHALDGQIPKEMLECGLDTTHEHSARERCLADICFVARWPELWPIQELLSQALVERILMEFNGKRKESLRRRCVGGRTMIFLSRKVQTIA